MINAVIFDFGQTLVDSADGFRKAEKLCQAKLYADLALTIREDFLVTYRKLRKSMHDQFNFSRKALFREVYHYYCLIADDGLLEKWETEYWDTVKANTKLFPETKHVLESLNIDYAVGMITNTQGQKSAGTHRISLFPEVEKFFTVIMVAGEGGIPPKPDPRPFRCCVEKLGVAPSEAVYVGDDWRIDICGAQAAGLHPIWLQHHTVKRNWPEVKTDVPIITRLDELFDLDKLCA